jgi:hypothetical protein
MDVVRPSIRLIETINGSNITAAVRMHNTTYGET